VAGIRNAIEELAQRVAEAKAMNTQEVVEGTREEDTYSDIGEEFLNDEEIEGRYGSTSPDFDEGGFNDSMDREIEGYFREQAPSPPLLYHPKPLTYHPKPFHHHPRPPVYHPRPPVYHPKKYSFLQEFENWLERVNQEFKTKFEIEINLLKDEGGIPGAFESENDPDEESESARMEEIEEVRSYEYRKYTY
jgi:hypothetical protein